MDHNDYSGETTPKEFRLLDVDFAGRERELGKAERARVAADVERLVSTVDVSNGDIDGISVPPSIGSLGISRKTVNALEREARESFRSVGEVIGSLHDTPIENAVSLLASPVSKTSWQEKYQREILETRSRILVGGVEKLPVRGKKAVKRGDAKSFDLKSSAVARSGRSYTVLIACKYTDGRGGAQDNQRHDLESFARVAPMISSGGDEIFVLIADGSHYDGKFEEYNGLTFFEYIDRRYAGKLVVATTTAEFDRKLGQLLLSL